MVNNYDVAVLSEKVAYLEAAIKNAGIELPEVTSEDNGKGLQVVNGAWDTGAIIPDPVTANPTGEITNEVTALQIGSTKYTIGTRSRVISTIAANEYNNYGLALAALKTAYDGLTLEEKLRSVVMRGDNVTYQFSALTGGYGAIIPSSDTTQVIESIFLNESPIYLATTLTSTTTSTASKVSDAQAQKLLLMLI